MFIVMLQLHNYKFEGKNNRRFCYNNWRHVGEHVERNWLPIRRSPCNKRSTCWSVQMCCKKTSWVTFKKKKSLYFTYSCFLVINVCNQGKTLCSPCIIWCMQIEHLSWQINLRNVKGKHIKHIKTECRTLYVVVTLSRTLIFSGLFVLGFK